MKILHTSDWHLGKKLYKVSRLKEQARFLEWLIDYICDNEIDILLISGDIFDVPTPPNEALKLYFTFLKKLNERKEIPIFIIGGNHDSSNFIEAPSPFLELNNIYVVGSLEKLLSEDYSHYIHNLEIKGEKLSISLLPYFRTHELFNLAKAWNINIEEGLLPVIEELMKRFLDRASGQKILMSHHLFGSYEEAGSEQGLNLSGIDSIPTNTLQGFDYVALGHIHKAQTVRKSQPIVHYSGSPLAFRFSETSTKEVSIISIENDELSFERTPIKEFDKLLRVNCQKEEVEEFKNQIISSWGNRDDLEVFLELRIKCDTPITSMAETLREEFRENKIHLLSFAAIVGKVEDESESKILEKSLRTEELFELFYKKKYPESNEIPKPLLEDFNELLESIRESYEA
ncbi:putative exonuclease [Halobacteriovorax marinus SJ]|uniref:Nuclease SbcCD subunit D n=1 Tax=Halobacteriovorax marinus (strain ATCC BAA-682 / DSM 15412 / SJ) TaxID=862908 RepID=E1X1Z4_HALMS|nr:exonuclease SbcCD subunit D [Halobacteriovorax marinus]CBW26654.1 putative exonuclease [Halobacteriovorax marinus SJ]